MKAKDFDIQARKLFGQLLLTQGFDNSKSSHSTFYRELPGDIVHVVIPDPGTRRIWFDVKVFSASPRLDPLFRVKFPDYLGIPADSACYLNKRSGIGIHQQTFKCATADEFSIAFAQEVTPLLLQRALPYLDAIQSMQDLVPSVRNQLYRALALNYVGDAGASRLVNEQLERLKQISQSNPNDADIGVLIAHCQHLSDSAG